MTKMTVHNPVTGFLALSTHTTGEASAARINRGLVALCGTAGSIRAWLTQLLIKDS